MMRDKKIWSNIIFFVIYSLGIVFCSTSVQASEHITIDEATFPDTAFRSYVADVLDVNDDGSLSVGEQQIVTEMTISASTYRCANLKGLEYFPNLSKLTYNSGTLTELDLSKNVELMEVSCQYVKLTTLDLSSNTKLEILNCSYSKLESLNLKQNTELRNLFLTNATSLAMLDLSNNKKLETVSAAGSSIAGKLDVSGCAALKRVYVTETSLEEIDASGCVNLTNLYAQDTNLTTINLSGDGELKELVLDETDIETLSLKDNVKLSFLSLSDMPLKQLDLSKNTQLSSVYLGGTPLDNIVLNNHPELNSIEVGSKESTTMQVDLTGEKPKLNSVKIYGANSIKLDENDSLLYYTLINCPIEQLDVSNLQQLKTLVVDNVPIRQLDVSNNANLTYLAINETQIDNIDVSALSGLKTLLLENIALKSLDITETHLLTDLKIVRTEIGALDLSKQTELLTFTANYNNITSLDFSSCTKIKKIDASNNPLMQLTMEEHNELKEIILKYCSLYALDVSGAPNLQILNTDFNYAYPKVSYSKKLYFADMPGFESEKISDLKGGTLQEDHILWTSDEQLYYYYDVGNSTIGKRFIKVFPEINLELEDAPTSGQGKDDENQSDNNSGSTENGNDSDDDSSSTENGNDSDDDSDSTEEGAASDSDSGSNEIEGTGGTVGEDDSGNENIINQSVDLLNTSVSTIATQQYCGMEIKPLVTISYKGKTLVENQDYIVKYCNNIECGVAKAIITGKGQYSGDKTITFTIEPFDVSELSNILKGKDGTIYKATYTKKPICLATKFRIATVYKGDKVYLEPEEGRDYTLRYKNNKKIGTASIIYSFKGNYTGTLTKKFQIVPPTTKVTSVKKSGSKLVIKWKKVSSCDRYEVYRATSKNGKYKKIATVKGKNKCAYKDKKVKKGKKYYYKVKACKKVKGTTYKSDFSNAKKGKR